MQKIAIPTINGSFSPHFGGADGFAIFEVDEKTGAILSAATTVPPPHQHGSFPKWLKNQNVNVVLAGGMGQKAVTMLQEFGIQVVLGISFDGTPEELVYSFLAGTLVASGHSCHDHGFHHHGQHQ